DAATSAASERQGHHLHELAHVALRADLMPDAVVALIRRRLQEGSASAAEELRLVQARRRLHDRDERAGDDFLPGPPPRFRRQPALGGPFAPDEAPPLRHASEGVFPPNGLTGVLWAYTALTVLGLFIIARFLPRVRTPEAEVSEVVAKTLGSVAASVAEAAGTPVKPRVLSAKWLREHPLSDGKFSFFIFVLIPVQTLFAHNWLTLPLYIERAFRSAPWVSSNFEFFSNLNPLLIFVLTPLVTALTTRLDVYKSMIVGTTVMAVPTFLLALGPSPGLLLLYTVLMSVGEALWQPRFLQYVAEIAPPGKTGMYMGVAQFPWFMTKLITGMYSGWFLSHYCPAQGAQNTEAMWLIYSLIACSSPVGLILAKGWVGKAISGRLPPGLPG
ncbi:MAG TPA: hypothetical protein PLW65_27040, partial [Pseudomonadota bacterium]|nr:hypothetical protein [Pseudomonadota bacterium]